MRAVSRALLLGGAMVSVAGCSSSDVAGPPAGVPRDAVAVRVDQLESVVPQWLRSSSGIAQAGRLAIRDAAEWRSFWTAAVSGMNPPPAVPEIDFGQYMLVAATAGTRPGGGYSIHVDQVYRGNNALYAVVRQVSPGRSCATTGALTAPLAVVQVPRSELPVRFVERAETRECR